MGRTDSEDSSDAEPKSATFEEVFKKLVGPVQHSLLVPLFFASIGHAIVSQRHVFLIPLDSYLFAVAVHLPLEAGNHVEGRSLRHPDDRGQGRHWYPCNLLFDSLLRR